MVNRPNSKRHTRQTREVMGLKDHNLTLVKSAKRLPYARFQALIERAQLSQTRSSKRHFPDLTVRNAARDSRNRQVTSHNQLPEFAFWEAMEDLAPEGLSGLAPRSD